MKKAFVVCGANKRIEAMSQTSGPLDPLLYLRHQGGDEEIRCTINL